MTRKHILAKICLYCLGLFGIILINPTLVMAAAPVTGKYEMTMRVNNDYSADISFKVDLTNTATDLVRSYNLTLPFTRISSVSATRDNLPITANVTAGDTRTNFSIEFEAGALRTGQTAQVGLNFHLPAAVSSNFGITQLYLPKLESDYDVTRFNLIISYPNSFPKPNYTSDPKAVEENHKVTLNALRGALVLWGDEAIYDIQDSVDIKQQNTKQVISNFVPKFSDQDVVYKSTYGVRYAATDMARNIWAVADTFPTALKYQARVHRLPLSKAVFDQQVQITYATFDPPAEFSSAVNIPQTELQKAQAIYDFLITNYKASSKANLSRGDLAQLPIKANKIGSELTNLEFAALGASLMQSQHIPVHVAYGYIIASKELGEFNCSRPHVWLEAYVDKSVIIMDPYLEAVTGFNFWNTTTLNRLEMGVWDPQLEADSVLGILGNGLRPAPLFTSLGEIKQALKYDMSGDFPRLTSAGEDYTGKLVIDNHSGYFISFADVTLNGESIINQLQFAKGLTFVALPLTTTTLELKGLQEPNLLEDRTTNNKITVTPTSELLPPQNFSYLVTFKPNQKIIVFLLTVGLAGVTFLVIAFVYIITRHFVQHRKRG